MIIAQAPVVYIHHPLVAASQCAATKDGVVVSVILNPVYGRTARMQVLKEVAEEVQGCTGQAVVVCCDMSVYQCIAHGSEVDFQSLAARRGAYHLPMTEN